MKKKTKLLLRDAFLSTILTSILFVILSIAFINLRFFNPIHQAFKDFSFLDVYYSERFNESNKINKDIVLVNIRNYKRDKIALLLEAVIEQKPEVIGFDVVLEKRINKTTTDSLLCQLVNHKKVVTTFTIKDADTIIKNDCPKVSLKKGGYDNFNFDKHSVIREIQGITKVKNKFYESFATKIAHKYLSKKKWKKYNYKELLQQPQILKYSGDSNNFLVLSFEDFILNPSKVVLKDKIVILGYNGDVQKGIVDIQDKFFTPLNKSITGKSDRDMHGMFVHANIVNMLINNDFIRKVPNFWVAVIVFLTMYLSTILYMKMNKSYKISFRTRKQTYQFFISVFVLLLCFWLYSIDIALSPFPIIVGIVLAGSYFKYYKHLTRFINTKRKWKTYLK